ncbi:hypothetical protein M758_3G162700, partial [Ceratodon purpureus]
QSQPSGEKSLGRFLFRLHIEKARTVFAKLATSASRFPSFYVCYAASTALSPPPHVSANLEEACDHIQLHIQIPMSYYPEFS